jgi:4-aminobutyrate aminotransferase-like enzyme
VGARLAALQERGLFASAVAAAIADQESVLVLPAVGEANVLRVIPPLVMEAPEIDRAVAAIDAVLTRLASGVLG